MKTKAVKVLSAGLLISVFAACTPDEEGADNGEANGNNNVNNEEENNNNEANDNEENDGETGPTQSPVADEDSLLDAVGEEGAWILTFEEDVSVDEELVLEGDQTNDGETERKVALYENDSDETFTLTAPEITILNENARIQGGTFEGDVYVEEDGFTLTEATVDGNIYFASEEYEESSEITDDSEVTGEIEVE